MFNQKRYRILKSSLLVIALLLITIFIIKQLSSSKLEKPSNKSSEYVGKDACIECHKTEYNDWKGSDHDLSMDIATDSSVLGDFNNAELRRGNQVHKAFKRDGKFYVITDNEKDEMQEFEVKYVFGHYPLQNYLVEFPGGRLQTLALTWNSKDNNWYYMADSVYQGMSVTHKNWLHWTNQSQNWNSMCADCHSTNLKKGYDPITDTYHTTWSEIDVSCEACHGPASKHLEWAKLDDDARNDIENYGLTIKTSGVNNHQFVDNCARCHSRRSSLEDFDPHSKSIYNHMIPELPSEPSWYIDGQIKEEDYVYASFTQSVMYMEGVACNNCHNVHSGKLILQGNKLCLQCHKAADYDTPTHTFHKSAGEEGKALISAAGVKFEVGSGTECINCHMHGQNFMGVDYRRDHSFRIPRPDLSIKNGTPNACNQCHKDKSNKWAADYIVKWFGENRPFQYGEAFAAARDRVEGADVKLLSIINNKKYSPKIRALAITYLKDADKDIIDTALSSSETEIRLAAIDRIEINSQEKLNRLLPLLFDETKAVRIETAYKLAEIDTNLIPKKYKGLLKSIDKEKVSVLDYNSDFPVGKYNYGNYYFQHHDLAKAEEFYLKAIAQDDELFAAKMNLASLYSAAGKPLKAEATLESYIKQYPNDGNALYNYGLILSENKKYNKSLEYLLKASKLLPHNSRVDYNIAMLYVFYGEKSNAEAFLKLAIQKNTSDFSNYSNLLSFYKSEGLNIKAQNLMAEMRMKFPQ